MTGVLVLITGPGRSGTSTLAGALHHLGLYVPGPYLGANASNPKGFYESRWAMRFHKRIFGAAQIHDFDSRPWAEERVQGALTPEDRVRLVKFLRKHGSQHAQVVVKDPRSAWVHGLWKEAAEEAGLGMCYVSMMRHPAEVVGSRSTYYAADVDEGTRQRYITYNVARWVNGSLVNEGNTRGERRAFVPYLDLLRDWRTTLRSLQDALGLTFDVDLTALGPHPVDEFIDPALRRHEVTWDDLAVPASLQSLAEQIWQELCGIQERPAEEARHQAELDRLRVRYDTLFEESAAIAHDRVLEAHGEGLAEGLAEGRTEGRTAGRREGLAEGRKRGLAEGRKRGLAEGRARGDARAQELLAAERAAPVRAADVPGQELLAEVGRRVGRRAVRLVRGPESLPAQGTPR